MLDATTADLKAGLMVASKADKMAEKMDHKKAVMKVASKAASTAANWVDAKVAQ